MAAGLVPLLLLTALPGCVARHMPDWSKVQAVAPDTKTEVHLYEDKRKLKGRFLSATDDSIMLQLTDRTYKDGLTRTFQKSAVRKVQAHRALGKRWPGWLALGVAVGMGTVLTGTFSRGGDLTDATKILFGGIVPVAISSAFFYGSRMGGIYEVPPEHRDWVPKGTSLPAAGTEEPKESQ